MLAQLVDIFDCSTWWIIYFSGVLGPAVGCGFLARRSRSWKINRHVLNNVTSFYVAALAMQSLHGCAFLVVVVFGIIFGLWLLVRAALKTAVQVSELSSLVGKQAIGTFAVLVVIVHSFLMNMSFAYSGFWYGR